MQKRVIDPLDESDAAIAQAVSKVAEKLPLESTEPPRPRESIAAKRRRRGQPRPGQLATVGLVRSDGVLRWTYQRPPSRVGPRRSRFRAARMVGARPIVEFSFQEVEPNAVIKKLQDLDNSLTPNQGLRRWQAGVLTKVDQPAATPRLLLFVHGTFSKSEALFDELQASPAGKTFLATAEAHYKQILAFDHPTLSVSPVLNALDLERALGGYKGEIDIICHSRGGLVAAWWLRTGLRNVKRVICVGAPLEGTSLAAPARIKVTLDYYANVAHAIETAAKIAGGFAPPMAPLLGMTAGLMSVIGGALSLGSRTPLVDAGVAIVPGLSAQSRVENNQELLRLQRDRWPSQPEIYAVRSDFEPGDPDAKWWEFWRRWNRPLLRVADSAADRIFDEPNDLVVDLKTMVRANSLLPAANVYSFATNNRVHHCNYFAQPETVDRFRKWLKL
jgi:pimeloyl-ACP methyl ester carboxylesterase